MSLRDEIEKNEKIFPGNPSIKYYFKPSNSNLKALLIGFSGFHGQESEGIPPKYNYVKYLKNLDVNQLYILDGNKDNVPLYYIGENGQMKYEEKVIQLILYIAKQEEIPLSRIITFGSSKGGTAAAYFSMKYSLGNFISAGMQTRAGDYLKSNAGFTRDTILKTIAGEHSNTPETHLNNVLMDVFNNPLNNTNYYLHGGKEDTHYINYVKPFHKVLDEQNIKYKLDVSNYSNHGEIGEHFLPFLMTSISEILDIPVIRKTSFTSNNGEMGLNIDLYRNIEDVLYAVYLFEEKSNVPIKKIPYQRSNDFKVELKPGKYRARIYLRKNDYISKFGTGYYIHNN